MKPRLRKTFTCPQILWGIKLVHAFLFWGVMFGNYHRKRDSVKFLGEINPRKVMIPAVHPPDSSDNTNTSKYFSYSYSCSLGAVWLISVIHKTPLRPKHSHFLAICFFGEEPCKMCQNIAVLHGKSNTQTHCLGNICS